MERFNGAAAAKLRKRFDHRQACRFTVELQWGRSCEAAETPPPGPETPSLHWLEGGRSCEAAETLETIAAQRCTQRFNGAAAAKLRKQNGPQSKRREPLASMGPQLRSCGNIPGV